MLSPGMEMIVPCLKAPFTLYSQPRQSQQWKEHTHQSLAFNYLCYLRVCGKFPFFHTLAPKRNWWVIFFSFLELGRLRYGCKEEEEDRKRRKHRCFWAWPWSKVIIPHSHILLKAPNLKHCHSSGNAAFLQSLWVSFLSIYYPKTLEALDIAVSSAIKEVPIL